MCRSPPPRPGAAWISRPSPRTWASRWDPPWHRSISPRRMSPRPDGGPSSHRRGKWRSRCMRRWRSRPMRRRRLQSVPRRRRQFVSCRRSRCMHRWRSRLMQRRRLQPVHPRGSRFVSCKRSRCMHRWRSRLMQRRSARPQPRCRTRFRSTHRWRSPKRPPRSTPGLARIAPRRSSPSSRVFPSFPRSVPRRRGSLRVVLRSVLR